MAPLYRSHTVIAGAAATSRVITKPAGTASGDLLLLHIVTTDTTTITVPSGFVLVQLATGASYKCSVYQKTAGGSEPADYTIGFSVFLNSVIGLVACRSDAALPLVVDAQAGQYNASSANRTWASVTTTVANTLLLCFMGIGNAANAPDAAMTERYDDASSIRCYLMTQTLASAGATGTRVATGSAIASACVTVAVAEQVVAPTSPSGLTATPISSTQINLAWTDNASNETGYEVERSPNGSTGWSLLVTTAANAVTYSDTGLAEGTQFWYRVRAVNGAGGSAYTSVANATTTMLAPSGLAAVGESASSISLSWTDESAAETGYEIEQSSNGVTGWVVVYTTAPGATSHLVTGLSANQEYWFRARAFRES